MTAPAWMPLYIADYLADTGHLSTIEHGAYVLLIMHYWQHKGLPSEEKIARIARMTAKEWAGSRDTLASLFGPGWMHKRVDHELMVAEQIADKRSTAGRTAGLASAAARQRNVRPNSNDSPTTVERRVNPLPSPSPDDDKSSSSGGQERSDRLEAELRASLGERAPPENVDFAPILKLIEAGYDPVKDVLAACRAAAGKSAETVGSWGYYAEAVSRKSKAATPSEPVTWLSTENPLWDAMAERYQHAKGHELRPIASNREAGRGAYIPRAWVEVARISSPH